MAAQVRSAVTLVWLIASLLLLTGTLAAVVQPDAALRVAGFLATPHAADEPCAACGMTRAVVALARGDVREAAALHRGALLLLPAVLVNGTLAAVLLSHRRRRLRPGGGRGGQ
jgi:hypothetical protein